MRVLLDTNILIHREASTVVRRDIGNVFYWLDKLRHDKCAHPVSVEEIQKHKDEKVRAAFQAKLQSYHTLKTTAPMSAEASQFSATDQTANDRNDTIIINEVFADGLTCSSRKTVASTRKPPCSGSPTGCSRSMRSWKKSQRKTRTWLTTRSWRLRRPCSGTSISQRTSSTASARTTGAKHFDRWFARKADETAYVCYKGKDLVAFLYVKVEGPDENYSDIEPHFTPKRRLKIGTFKVEMNGYKLGERFLKIIFDNALRQGVDDVYVTIFPNTPEQRRLIRLLQDFGFTEHGVKIGFTGKELVLVRGMRPPTFDASAPALTFPYVSMASQCHIVPIYPAYHTSLLPDSILRTESPANFVEQFPHRNAIRKVYISRSINRNLKPGDSIVFYRTGGYYAGVATTVGIVEHVYTKIRDADHFISLCRKRSVFADKELIEYWNYNKDYRPFIVEFLYAYAFTKRPNLKELIDHGIIRDVTSAPRGFEPLTKDQFRTILQLAQADARGFIH